MEESSRPTLRQIWGLVGAVSLAVMGLSGLDARVYPGVTFSALTGASLAASAVGHALLIAWDRRRRDLEVGNWGAAGFAFQPFALWAYLLVEYPFGSVLLIPFSVLLYLSWGLGVWLLG